MMRIRVIRSPPIESIEGIQLDCFHVGEQYQVGNTIGALFLAEGWAEPVPLDEPAPAVPFGEGDQYDSRVLYPDPSPPNLIRVNNPPSLDPDRTVVARHSRKARRNR